MGYLQREGKGIIKRAFFLCFLWAALLLLVGCNQGFSEEKMGSPGDEKKPVEEMEMDPKEAIDLSLKPNEVGRIMILMYHNIGEEEQEWVRTPENFMKDMKMLYEKGYRPISLRDYAHGNITTEQGLTPVVITFDDGNRNNFNYLENGQIDPRSAVGLLLNFHEEHQDFPLAATFFLNGKGVFHQKDTEEKKIRFLLDHGMDIGNHTVDHANLKNADAREIQKQIALQGDFLEGFMDSQDSRVELLALPYGGRPKEENLRGYLLEGNHEGSTYGNIAVLNVGWHPAYSPFDSRYDSANIPRIRASETKVDQVGLYNYLDYFDRHPEERFVSDGQPNVVTIPGEKEGALKSIEKKSIYLY